jgi:alcohol dehydrogenase class IV
MKQFPEMGDLVEGAKTGSEEIIQGIITNIDVVQNKITIVKDNSIHNISLNDSKILEKRKPKMKLMTAQEAFSKTLDTRTSRYKQELNEISVLINESISEGKASATIYKYLYPETKETLKSNGYKITERSPHNESETLIS